MKQISGVLLVLILGLSACTSSDDASQAQTTLSSSDPIERIAPEAFLAEQVADAVILDVRVSSDFDQGHLANAMNFDVTEADFKERVAGLDPDKTYYLYCYSGVRSGRAAEIMRDMGFTSLYNIGGYADLERAGAPVE